MMPTAAKTAGLIHSGTRIRSLLRSRLLADTGTDNSRPSPEPGVVDQGLLWIASAPELVERKRRGPTTDDDTQGTRTPFPTFLRSSMYACAAGASAKLKA